MNWNANLKYTVYTVTNHTQDLLSANMESVTRESSFRTPDVLSPGGHERLVLLPGGREGLGTLPVQTYS